MYEDIGVMVFEGCKRFYNFQTPSDVTGVSYEDEVIEIECTFGFCMTSWCGWCSSFGFHIFHQVLYQRLFVE